MKPIDKHDRALICRLGMLKLLAVMSLVFLPATGFSQTVRFSDRNLTLQQAFQEIERHTELTFAYNAGVLDVTSVVSLPSREMDVKDALDILLEGRNVDYEITNGQVIITKRETGPVHVYAGTVTDEADAPIYGAVVMIRGSGAHAMTDPEGKFSIESSEGSVMEVSFLGYLTYELTLGKSVNLPVSLRPDNEILNESVVVGYGTIQRRDITTAVSVVSTEDIDSRPIVSAASALQGRAAGVQVIQPSGMPGTSLSIRVRGATSVQASNEPLYVVDGVPMDDISNLSPGDIESMQVLKDASSSAIYGARAANGVVIITTKRGHSGKPTVSFNAYAGVSFLGKKIEALNTEQYKELMKELAEVTSTVPTIPDDEHRYTDWNDELFNTGVNQNYQLSLSNGNDKFRYFISATHTDEKGIVNKAYFRRTGVRANIDSDMFKWLTMNMNFSYTHNAGRTVYESRSSLRAGSILLAVNTPPFMQVWDPDVPGQYDEDAYGSRIMNPMAANAADMTSQTDRVVGSLGLDFKITRNLSFKTTYSIDLNNSRNDYYLDPVSTSDGRSTKGAVSEGTSRNLEWLFENVLSYDNTFNLKHKFSAMAGATLQHAQWNGNNLAGFDLPEAYPQIHSVAAANQLNGDEIWSSAGAWSLASFIARVSYSYDDKYLLTVNCRADGSSRFAPGERWGIFPSVSAGWRISSENWMSGTKDVLDDLKIRAGWGMNGNQSGIGNYDYLAYMNAVKVLPSETNAYPGLAFSPNTLANTELSWEKTTQYNVGVDVSLFKERIVFNADAYIKRTTDLLLTIPLPDNMNYPGGITRNDGEMINKGMEFALSTVNFDKEFRWTTDFNISFNKNEVKKLGLNKVYYYASTYTTGEPAIVLKEGLPLGSFYGYISNGVDPETGDLMYVDVSDNGSIGPEDRTVIGCAQPKFIYGFTNDFSYKGITLSIFFQGSYGNEIFNASRIETEGMFDFRNQSTAVLRRWKRPGMITDVPRVGNVDNIKNSTRFIEDGSYLRLKNVTLAYSLPKKILSKATISELQFYITAQNLLTFTKYSGYDPEVNAYGTSSTELGVDYGTYPQSRTFIFGVNIQF